MEPAYKEAAGIAHCTHAVVGPLSSGDQLLGGRPSQLADIDCTFSGYVDLYLGLFY